MEVSTTLGRRSLSLSTGSYIVVMILNLQKILCLVSKGASTSPVLEKAQHLARKLDASLHVLPSGFGKGPTPKREELRQLIGSPHFLDSEESLHLPSADEREPGKGPDSILQYLSDADIDLVVFSTPADRGAVPALAAPAVESLIGQLDRPAFVVSRSAASTHPQRILVPTDFSDHSVEALRHARGLASLYGATVDLLHVMDRSSYVALTQKDQLSLSGTTLTEHRARRRLQQIVRRGERDDVLIDSHLRFGRPADQISRFVAREEIDLLVLSTHGTQTHFHRSFGEVADRVLRRVTCPVFLVPSFGRSLLPRQSVVGRRGEQEPMQLATEEEAGQSE